MLIIGSMVAASALAGTVALGAPTPTPTTAAPTAPPTGPPTTPPTEPPTTPPTSPGPSRAEVSVTPATVDTAGAALSIKISCPNGTLGAWVTSKAFGRQPGKGEEEVGARTTPGLAPGRYVINLLCDGTTVSAQTMLTVIGPSTGPTPSGAPQTGDGTTAETGKGALYLTGLGLIGLGSVAGANALRSRRRESGA